MKSTLAFILVALLASASAFTPASRPVLTPGRLIQGGQNLHTFVLRAEEKAAAEEEAPSKVSADGTYYDDEVREYCTRRQPDLVQKLILLLENYWYHSALTIISCLVSCVFQVEPAPKAGISDSMKERLLREASTGLDSEQKQTNILLYIIAAVAVLVVIGGQGVLY